MKWGGQTIQVPLSLSAAAFSLSSRSPPFPIPQIHLLLRFRKFAFFSWSSSSVPSPCSSTPLSLSQSQHHSPTHTSKIEGSQATAKQTAELIRSVISAQRVPYTNQAGALIDAVKAVGEQLIAANPIGNVLKSHISFVNHNDPMLLFFIFKE